jgi:hypothetical protein
MLANLTTQNSVSTNLDASIVRVFVDSDAMITQTRDRISPIVKEGELLVFGRSSPSPPPSSHLCTAFLLQ